MELYKNKISDSRAVSSIPMCWKILMRIAKCKISRWSKRLSSQEKTPRICRPHRSADRDGDSVWTPLRDMPRNDVVIFAGPMRGSQRDDVAFCSLGYSPDIHLKKKNDQKI